MGLSQAVPAAFPSSCVPVLWQEHALCAMEPRECHPAACLESTLARQSSEESWERSSNAGDFHYLLLRVDFFFTLQNVIIALG